MGDFTNGLSLLTHLDRADVTALFDLPTDGPAKFEYAPGKVFPFRFEKLMAGRSHFGRLPDVGGFFADRPRSEQKSALELEGEIGFVLRWLELGERAPAGLYHIEQMPYLYWDHQSDSIVVNSHIRLWETPESRLLRQTMHERNLPFTTQKNASTSDPWLAGFNKQAPNSPSGFESLWSANQPGALRLACSACELGFRLELGRTFSFPENGGSVVVDLPGVKGLLLEVADAIENNNPDLGDPQGWNETLVGLLALLISDGQNPPAQLTTGTWSDWSAQARELAETVRPSAA